MSRQARRTILLISSGLPLLALAGVQVWMIGEYADAQGVDGGFGLPSLLLTVAGAILTLSGVISALTWAHSSGRKPDSPDSFILHR